MSTPAPPSISDLATAFETSLVQLSNDTSAQQATAQALSKAQVADQSALVAISTDKSTIFDNGTALITAIQATITPYTPLTTQTP